MALLVVPLLPNAVVCRRHRASSSSSSNGSEELLENAAPVEVRLSSSIMSSIYNRTPGPPLPLEKRPISRKWTPDIGHADRMARRIRKLLLDSPSSSVEAVLLDWKEPISSRGLVAVLNGFGDDWKKGLEFFNWAKSLPRMCEVTKFSYNVVLKLLRNGQQWEESVKLLEEMLSKNILPDSYSFTMLINCAKVTGQIEEAIGWFEKLTDSGFAFDDITLSSMIDLYGRAGRTAEAIELYQSMRDRNRKLDVVSYGVLANIYARTDDYIAIKNLFEEMEELGVQPNAVLYNILLGALNRASKVNMATEIFYEMERRRVRPTVVTLRIMINLYTKVGAVETALKLYETIMHKKWDCDVGVYNTLLASFVDSGNVESAEEVMNEMYRVGCKPDQQTFGTLMNVYATRALAEHARNVFDRALAQGIAPTTTYYTVLIRACKQARQFSKIPGVFEEMRTSGCAPDLKLNGMLLSCVTNAFIGDRDRRAILECLGLISPRLHHLLSQLLHRDRESGPPDVMSREICCFIGEDVAVISQKAMCNSFVDFCWALGDKEAAHEILEAATAAGFYKGLHTKLPTIWQLNLRTLSLAAAECALEAWLKRLRGAVLSGEELPEEFMIETGTGRAKEAINSMKLAVLVQRLLRSRNLAFEAKQGYFITSRYAARIWIEDALQCQDATDEERRDLVRRNS